jgi:hypothetical protein
MERAARPLVIDGETISVRVRESGRARRLRVTVGSTVEAVVPRRVSDGQLDRFLEGYAPGSSASCSRERRRSAWTRRASSGSACSRAWRRPATSSAGTETRRGGT